MGKLTTNRVVVLGACLGLIMLVANATAQTGAIPSTRGMGQQTQPKGGPNHTAAERNPGCQRIIAECKKLGFIPGQWKQDNGLWKDCFDPIVKGNGGATRDGKPISVPVSSSDIQSCRASEGHHMR
jgi:hypothetical protein